MRTVKVRCLRRLIARNHAALTLCCGDDVNQICDDCNIRYNLMNVNLRKLAHIFTGKNADDFSWVGTTLYKCGSLSMEMKTAESSEVFKIWITGTTVKEAVNHVLAANKSAKRSKRPK